MLFSLKKKKKRTTQFNIKGWSGSTWPNTSPESVTSCHLEESKVCLESPSSVRPLNRISPWTATIWNQMLVCCGNNEAEVLQHPGLHLDFKTVTLFATRISHQRLIEFFWFWSGSAILCLWNKVKLKVCIKQGMKRIKQKKEGMGRKSNPEDVQLLRHLSIRFRKATWDFIVSSLSCVPVCPLCQNLSGIGGHERTEPLQTERPHIDSNSWCRNVPSQSGAKIPNNWRYVFWLKANTHTHKHTRLIACTEQICFVLFQQDCSVIRVDGKSPLSKLKIFGLNPSTCLALSLFS